MKKNAQKTLDFFLNIKNKRRQFFYIDWNEESPIAVWVHSKPKSISWSRIVKFKEIGDIIICCKEEEKMEIDLEDDILMKQINLNNKIPEAPSKILSFLKSHLQKCVRRANTILAVQTALALLTLNKDEFVRRLSIIVFEDVRVKTYYPTLVWLVSSLSKGFTLTPKIVNILLMIVVDLCTEKIKDNIEENIKIEDKDKKYSKLADKIESNEVINDEAKSFLISILFRMTYGGMSWDIDMLGGYVITWFNRLKKGESVPSINKEEIQKLKDIWDFHKIKKMNTFLVDDFIIEGADFHCFPMILDEIINETNSKYTKEELKSCIWEYSSKINSRTDNIVLDKKLEIIWSDIKSILRKLQFNIISDMITQFKLFIL